MKTKYDIELTINKITNTGKMEINDNCIELFIENEQRIIFFKNIKENTIENELLKLTLVDNTTLLIKTVETKDINSFITLQKEDNYPIIFKKDEEYMKKYFRNGFITGFLIVFLYNIAFMDSFIFISSIIWGIIFGFIFLIVGNANSLKADRARSKCPHCHNDLILQFGDINPKLAIPENIIMTTACNNCGNKLGIKYNHVYKLTPENEKEFDKNIDTPKKHQKEPTNNSTVSDNNYEKLEKLKELLDKNVITQEDFDKKKEDILKQL